LSRRLPFSPNHKKGIELELSAYIDKLVGTCQRAYSCREQRVALLTDNEHMTERFTFIAVYQKRGSNKDLILIIEISMLIK